MSLARRGSSEEFELLIFETLRYSAFTVIGTFIRMLLHNVRYIDVDSNSQQGARDISETTTQAYSSSGIETNHGCSRVHPQTVYRNLERPKRMERKQWNI